MACKQQHDMLVKQGQLCLFRLQQLHAPLLHSAATGAHLALALHMGVMISRWH
jgi:hypothetical protein